MSVKRRVFCFMAAFTFDYNSGPPKQIKRCAHTRLYCRWETTRCGTCVHPILSRYPSILTARCVCVCVCDPSGTGTYHVGRTTRFSCLTRPAGPCNDKWLCRASKHNALGMFGVALLHLMTYTVLLCYGFKSPLVLILQPWWLHAHFHNTQPSLILSAVA